MTNLFDNEPAGYAPLEDPMLYDSNGNVGIVQAMRVEQREEAGVITENYDAFRGEAANKQKTRRSPKQKTRDNRLAAETSTDVDSNADGEEDELE